MPWFDTLDEIRDIVESISSQFLSKELIIYLKQQCHLFWYVVHEDHAVLHPFST